MHYHYWTSWFRDFLIILSRGRAPPGGFKFEVKVNGVIYGPPDVVSLYKIRSLVSFTPYMQKTCDVAEKAILAKKILRKKCVNRDKM